MEGSHAHLPCFGQGLRPGLIEICQVLKGSQELDTPMRMLIRKCPELAEIVLDQCYKEKHILNEGTIVDMNFEFIEDTFNYR